MDQPPPAPKPREALRIAVIGAGFGGLAAAILLRQAGFTRLTVFERAATIGGTWRDNAYPGAACDVPSHLYSFSFAPKPDWSARYAGQAEILAYLNQVADTFGLRPHLRLNTAIRRATFDPSTATWRLETASGGTESFDILIPALGQLSRPAIPPIPGLADFAGAAFHSAAWDPAVPLAGRRIALIGAAASAIQIAPELAPLAARLTVFQRTPNWIIPRLNGLYGVRRHALFARLPPARRAFRFALWLYQELLFGAFRTGSRRNALLTRLARAHLRRQVPDPALRAKLTPAYTLGCKRLLVSDDYLPIFNRPNVRLETAPIARFEAAGIRTQDGTLHEAEVAVFATGFDVRHCLDALPITGAAGHTLAEAWAEGPEAYRGIAVPGFPNMFLMYGPNTNLGHSSIILMLEAQARYIRACLEHMTAHAHAVWEVRRAAHERYNAWLRAELGRTVWSTGCGNWYGQEGRITANWCGSTRAYIAALRRLAVADFQGAPGPVTSAAE